MMLTAVIIDDEVNGVKSLELLIAKYTPRLKLVGSTTSSVEGVDLINDLKPDIVFLDIKMPVLDGFELLQKLSYKNFYLIFTTAHHEFGLRALKQNATDYLLKPIGSDYIKEAVVRIETKIRLKQQAPDIMQLVADLMKIKNLKVTLNCKKSVEFVVPSEIVYIEADRGSTKVLLRNMELVEVMRPLKEYEMQLCDKEQNFIRIHNSYIININFVSRYLKDDGGYVVMQGKKKIPVSKLKKDEFLKLINLNIEH
jgi:two-component system, LytTR family, response regulator